MPRGMCTASKTMNMIVTGSEDDADGAGERQNPFNEPQAAMALRTWAAICSQADSILCRKLSREIFLKQ